MNDDTDIEADIIRLIGVHTPGSDARNIQAITTNNTAPTRVPYIFNAEWALLRVLAAR